ncbi:allantoate amidohydrolase [Halomonas sp. HL-93]|uniref:allantoate amidohydrolase n=1 Tax=Halomonas sp. HL-93 TaxID=1666906 RepID=UPI0006D9E156|nr:allantoate amidohydrolase [Halomonas sp. HL-93]KPQ21845.1 MAG: allantoate amidohydrolase HpxK [Halomonas sp. HL-93]SBR45671.1 allantoate deiminase [Halomonas sp. HL-93]
MSHQTPPTTFAEGQIGHYLLSCLDEAARYSQLGPGVTRLFCSPEHRQVLPLIEQWMQRAGLTPELDAAGNLVGRCPNAQAGKPTLIMGSHQDSVVEGGKYDGMLGIAVPLIALEALRHEGITLPYGVEVVAFGDEEGVRFPTTLVGSRALAGTVDPQQLEVRDAQGITLKEALRSFGTEPDGIPALARKPANTLGFVEVHIEQGPRLEQRDHAVGIVTALTGIERHQVTVSGKAGHAGTTPMPGRHDALVGAAEMVLAVDSVLQTTQALVGVVGQLDVRPNAVNVIPASVTFTIELRSPQSATRQQGREAVQVALKEIAESRGLSLSMDNSYRADGARCAEWIMQGLEQACANVQQPTERMFSGAGHDGLAMQDVTDIGMLFVRCKEGLSHHPDESISADDGEAAVRVMMAFLQQLDPAKCR